MKDTTYLYNAYAPSYDENYVLKSDTPIKVGTEVNDSGIVAKILSPYRPTSNTQPHELTGNSKGIQAQVFVLCAICIACFLFIAWVLVKSNMMPRKQD